AKKVEPQAVEKHVPRPRRRVQELERYELPDGSMLDAIHRQRELFEQWSVADFTAVNKHGALDDKSDDEHADEDGDYPGWVVGVPHVWPVGNHRGQTLVLRPAFSNGFNRFSNAGLPAKPLKRLAALPRPNTGLKPGANERLQETEMRRAKAAPLKALRLIGAGC